MTTREGFKSLEPIWNDLLQRSDSNTIFSTFEWLSTWWECFGCDKELFILLAKDGNEVIGIAPLMVERRKMLKYMPLTVISFVGTGISDYADFIICSERRRVISLFFDCIDSKRIKWERMCLRELSAESPNLPYIKEVIEARRGNVNVCNTAECPYISVEGDWHEYYSGLSRKFRQNLRTLENKLARYSYDVRISKMSSDVNREQLQNLYNMHCARIITKNKRSALDASKGKEFLYAIVDRMSGNGWLSLDVMNVGDDIAAYALGFKYAGKYYYWNLGMDRKYAEMSAGKLLLYNLIKCSFEDDSINEFDLLRGDEEYKYRWTKMQRKNTNTTIIGNEVYARIINKLKDLSGNFAADKNAEIED